MTIVIHLFSVGDHDKRTQENSETDHNIAKIIVHPKWDARRLNNDIALLQLTTPIKFDTSDYRVSPVCLPKNDPPVGSNCYITGIVSDLY